LCFLSCALTLRHKLVLPFLILFRECMTHVVLHRVPFTRAWRTTSRSGSKLSNLIRFSVVSVSTTIWRRRRRKTMGFRFNNLNPIYRSCITRLSSSKHLLPPPEPPSFFQLEASFISPQNPAFKIPHRWHFGHSHDHDHHHHPPKHLKEGENIFKLGLAADIALATGKAFTGYLSGSTAIIADAAHSISDVVCCNTIAQRSLSLIDCSFLWKQFSLLCFVLQVLSGIALLSFKVAKAPRDKEHPYGHLICIYTLLLLSLITSTNLLFY